MPGGRAPKSSRSRTNGERLEAGRAGEGGDTRSATVMYICYKRRTPPHPTISYHMYDRVKGCLTVVVADYAGFRVRFPRGATSGARLDLLGPICLARSAGHGR